VGEYAAPDEPLDATGMRMAVIAGRFNAHVSRPLVDGALGAFADLGLEATEVVVHWVPGAFEIPLIAKRLATSGQVDAVVCLGAVIRGDTAHFDYVAGPCAYGVAQVGLETGVPVVFGVLTTENEQQALDRAGGSEGNKGDEAARTAVEMVTLLRTIEHKGR
jgi:6,7-dimethyl-8-ribityllumazine synthase